MKVRQSKVQTCFLHQLVVIVSNPGTETKGELCAAEIALYLTNHPDARECHLPGGS